MALLLKLFARSNPEWDTDHFFFFVLFLSVPQKSYKIVAQHLHIPKHPLWAACLLFGDSSSNAFFAHLTPPSGTAVTQAHSTLRGREKGTEQRRSQGFKTSDVAGTQNDFQHASRMLIQHV